MPGQTIDPQSKNRPDLCRSIISRGEPPLLSSQVVKSFDLTSCSTRTSATAALTTFNPWAIPATHSLPRMAARPLPFRMVGGSTRFRCNSGTPSSMAVSASSSYGFSNSELKTQ
jgi:hypothetical protein